jgi:hypothetical protein
MLTSSSALENEASKKAAGNNFDYCPLSSGFGSLLSPKNGGDMVFRNAG